VFPLWLAYGFPLTVLKWIWDGLGYGEVPPSVAFYTIRGLMFVVNFILEDWALHELLPSARERSQAIMLVASSFVTWTYQMHTFSNSIETLLVLWSLVLIRRMREHSERTMIDCCCALSFLSILGTFNRITFPAFLVVPAVQLVPQLLVKPLRIPIIALSGMLFLVIAITADTEYYSSIRPRFRDLYANAVFTPWNNLIYNMDPSNLAEHGLHAFWQHAIANLPQLIGPAYPLLFISSRKSTIFWSAIVGIAVLSCFSHQEPRFLLPTVPLLLSSIRLPQRYARSWIAAWIAFNAFAGVLFGIYHQGGVVPAQIWISRQSDVSQVLWWKTYSPPRWLLDGQNSHVITTDLMGMDAEDMLEKLIDSSDCDGGEKTRTLLVAPASATFLDELVQPSSRDGISLSKLWKHRSHVGLDDLDFGDDGIWPTLNRVVGRRGLVVWQVHRSC